MQTSISYDPEYLTALNVENLSTDMNFLFHIDETAGLIEIVFAGVQSLESDMTISNIQFKAKEGYSNAISTDVSAELFMANETNLTWNSKPGTIKINGLTTGLEDFGATENKMLACYPNPFGDQLTIEYTIHKDENVQIAVYDMYGKMVSEIANGKHASETYKLQWDGNDANGSRLIQGTYFIRILTSNQVETVKVQLVR